MPRRTIAFLVFAFLVALGCIRLGVWQLSRLAERRARNAMISARLRQNPTSFDEATRDSAGARYRQVRLSGRYDYEHELVLALRTRQGAPGVNIITPLIVAPGDRAVLINRGWVYAPDAMRIDLAKWREGDTATVVGYVDQFSAGSGSVSTSSIARGVTRLDRDSIASELPYPIAPLLVVQRLGAEQAEVVEHPFRIEAPALDEGSHRSYAIQWFSFAVIAVVGSLAVARGSKAGAMPPKQRSSSGGPPPTGT
jgi:surfeit locus 1 family protein